MRWRSFPRLRAEFRWLPEGQSVCSGAQTAGMGPGPYRSHCHPCAAVSAAQGVGVCRHFLRSDRRCLVQRFGGRLRAYGFHIIAPLLICVLTLVRGRCGRRAARLECSFPRKPAARRKREGSGIQGRAPIIHHRMNAVKEAAVTTIRTIRTSPRSIMPESPISGILVVRRRSANCSGVSVDDSGAPEELTRER